MFLILSLSLYHKLKLVVYQNRFLCNFPLDIHMQFSYKILPVNLENINEYVLQLESTDIFKAFSSSVKSQLKRALTLYNEYVNNN